MAVPTHSQRQIIDHIMRYWEVHLVSPTIRELVDVCDWCHSTSHMHREVQSLISLRYLVRPNNRARALIPLRDCDGTAITVVMRRADGVEVQLGAPEAP